MSKGKKKLSLADLSREPLKPEDVEKLHIEIKDGTDRSAALIGGAAIDHALLNALNARFVRMKDEDFGDLFFSQQGVLSDLSSRIKIAHAIGIIDDHCRELLNAIRRIRNVFAHAIRPIDFGHELIVKQCELLQDLKVNELAETKLHPLRIRFSANCFHIEELLMKDAMANFGKLIRIGISQIPSRDISAQPQTPQTQNQNETPPTQGGQP